MAARKISLSKEKETLLITLYGKGEESRMPDSLLHDHFAADAMRGLDYDFARLHVTRDMMIGIAMRAHILDRWTRAFIARHPDSTVLHLGCGLDSRVFRIAPTPGVRWFDVDYPDVIALRRRLYPKRDNYFLIGTSVMDQPWLDRVPADRPVMIVAEGLLPYLAHDEPPRLLDRLTMHFPRGELAFDGYSRLGLRLLSYNPSVQATGASLHWSLDDPKELEAKVPKLRLLTELLAYDPAVYEREQIVRMSWQARMAIRTCATVPVLRRIGRLMHYRF